MALVPIPLSPFYVDDQTGIIWAPDPNGTRLSPNGLYKLAPQTPASSSTDPTTGQTQTTYNPITQQQAAGAYVGDPQYAEQNGAAPPGSTSSTPPGGNASSPPASSSSPSSVLSMLEAPGPLGVPRLLWGAGALVGLLLLVPPRGR